MTDWKIVPISKYQLLDVREEDLLNNGDFRKCDTYRRGGGYDQFPHIANKRLGKIVHNQFVAQLYGCNLDCPYCYVTRSGVWGQFKLYSTPELVTVFVNSNQEIFHLMGGAPALYIEKWPELINALPKKTIFHSDLLLTEKFYDPQILSAISQINCLYAVDIKGLTPEDYELNTRTKFKNELFWTNFDNIVKINVPFYLTFTNPDPKLYDKYVNTLIQRYGNSVMNDAFSIKLIDYKAVEFVDILPKKLERKIT